MGRDKERGSTLSRGRRSKNKVKQRGRRRGELKKKKKKREGGGGTQREACKLLNVLSEVMGLEEEVHACMQFMPTYRCQSQLSPNTLPSLCIEFDDVDLREDSNGENGNPGS